MKYYIYFFLLSLSFFAHGKEYVLYVINDRPYSVDLQLFNITHQIPADEKYRYSSKDCFITKEAGVKTLFAFREKPKPHAFFIPENGKKKKIALVEGDPCQEEHKVVLFVEYEGNYRIGHVRYGKDVDTYLKNKGKFFDPGTFTRFKIEKNQIRELKPTFKESYETDKSGTRWRTFTATWE